jgi:hypothetical protein
MTRINAILRSVTLMALLSVLVVTNAVAQECVDGDETCSAAAPTKKKVPAPVCGSTARCSAAATPFYQRGGSAQTYKPKAPVKSTVCGDTSATRYKAATWPYGRSNHAAAPNVTVHLKIYECATTVVVETENAKKEKKKKSAPPEEQCCCTPILASENDIQMEVWQTQPNGLYSSLTPGKAEGVCRATLPSGTTSFTTLAPGSTGIFGGLGPPGFLTDIGFYGPPVIHMLITSPSKNHEPLLLHLPMTMDRKTLHPKQFFGPDWRGPAHVTQNIKPKDQAFALEEWAVHKDDDRLDVTVKVFLTRATEAAESTSLQDTMCPSSWYGSPSSFFLEPIAVCAPSLLDFFPM